MIQSPGTNHIKFFWCKLTLFCKQDHFIIAQQFTHGTETVYLTKRVSKFTK
jgi:hypothetical protein